MMETDPVSWLRSEQHDLLVGGLTRTAARFGRAADEIERLRAHVAELAAELQMIATAFESWEEPKHDGTREWCSRCGTYLRGHVVAQASFTEDEWKRIRALVEAADAAGGEDVA